MCLVDFIKQDDSIWTRLQLFRQLATLIVANVAWRRANKLGYLSVTLYCTSTQQQH